MPDLGDVEQVMGELRPIGSYVIEPSTDHAGDHTPHRDRVGIIAGTNAAFFESATHQPHAGDDAERDHEPIGVDAQGTDAERAARRTWQTGDDAADTNHAVVTRFAKATASAKISSLS